MGHTGARHWGGRERLLLAVLPMVVLGTVLLLLAAPVGRLPVVPVGRLPVVPVGRLPVVPVGRLPATPVGRLPVARPPVPAVIPTEPGHGTGQAPGHASGPGTRMRYAVILSTVAGNVSDAVEVVREERRRTRAERDAFDEFRRRVEETPAAQESGVLGARPSVDATRGAAADSLPRIRRAYEETVMAVDHYDDEYDDTVAESLAEEFGPELGSQLVTGRAFTPLVKDQLLRTVGESRRDREEFVGTLDAEVEALEAARETLEGIDERLEHVTTRLPSEQSLDEVISAHGSLEAAREECAALLEERQRQRVDGHAAIDDRQGTIPDLQTYLYRSLPVTYPVLADATELLGRLERIRRQLSRELGARF